MLDQNALAQLSQLKSDIQATKDYAEGTVAATSGRYGFVRTDDGRDAFLNPEKMDRLLPGDRVKINVVENDKGKLEAEVEKLISSELKKFVGQYKVKGAGHFVVPAGPQFNRWIFIPPNQRKGTKEGEFVVAKLSRHPFKDGRAQANIVFRIGSPEDDYIEHKYTKAKYDLSYRFTEEQTKQSQTLHDTIENGELGDRKDLTELGFVTIDSAATLDMDDALYAEASENGHKLYVAIADPGGFLSANTPLAKHAENLGQTAYLLGGSVPMLPGNIAHHSFSLEEQKVRPSLVCILDINDAGEIVAHDFCVAKIRSSHKLSYQQVADFVENNNVDACPSDTHTSLTELLKISERRRAYRERECLLIDDHVDYDFKLNDRGHIEEIVKSPRNLAQQIVEEAMIATNIVAGAFLAQHKTGLHSIHKGFREDRIGEVKALLKEEQIDAEHINDLEGHITLIKHLASDEKTAKLIPALRRMMIASELSNDAGPHLGMGLASYATITSPIRRFADLYNQWCIHAICGCGTPPSMGSAQLETLNEVLFNVRRADRELQQWLICIYAESLIGSVTEGQIRIVTQQGFGVRIDETGVEGFVLFEKKVEKSFDAKRMSLKVGDQKYHIGDKVRIKVSSVDQDKRRIGFELA
jgi:VacB/RNase II family 3'-5' exoribonuclease